jgi:predicted nucleic acid-binding protein
MEVGKTLEDRGVTFVTSDTVLVEVMAYVSHRGSLARTEAVDFVRLIRSRRNTIVLEQTRELFDRGLELYEQRADKAHSLADTMSMVICRERRIRSVLTHDRHFAQEGFEILL